MKQTTIPVKPASKMNVIASGDLSIEGGTDNLLRVIARESDSLRITEKGESLEIHSESDCRLILPETLVVTVQKCGGDIFLQNLNSRVIIGKVGGDLTMRSVAGVSVETVGGDISLRLVTGGVEIARVGGDLYLDQTGLLACGLVGGDADLNNVIGSVVITAGGDVVITSALEELPEMTVKAGGDARMIVPPAGKAQLHLVSAVQDINVHACGQEVNWNESELTLSLGGGGNNIRVVAGGSISVSDKKNHEDRSDDSFDDLQKEWQDFGINMEMNLREGMNLASESISRAAEKASKAAEKVMEKIEKSGKRIEGKLNQFDRKGKWVGVSFDEPVPLREKRKPGTSDEERMLVLRMLQEKKISVEEAERLLSALES